MLKKCMSIIAATSLLLTACTSPTEESGKTDEKQPVGTGEKQVLRVVMKDAKPSDPVGVKYFDLLEQKLKTDENLNVDFQLVEVPEGNYAEKLNLLLLSGDIPDIIYFQGGDQQISKQGLLEDLNPYIEKSKYIKDSLGEHNKARLENYPYLLWIKPLAQSTPVIRKDWFDKLKTSKALLENPTSDNYYNFFKEVKANPPGGADKPKYAITAAGEIKDFDSIFNMSFGITSTWLKNSDGTFEYAKTSKNEKEKLAFYNKLYSEGLMDPQYLTKKWDTKEKAFYDGEAAVIVGTAGKVIDIYDGKMKQVNGSEATMQVLPAAKGVGQGFGATDVTKESRGIAISSQSKNKNLAFQVLDYLASPKGQMFDRLGFENEDYKVVDGKIELTEKYYQEWYARFWEPKNFTPDKPLKTPLLGAAAENSLQSVQQFYVEDNNFIIPDEYISNWDAMENLYKEYATDIITGKKPIADFDKFVEEWKKQGGDDITKYANEHIK